MAKIEEIFAIADGNGFGEAFRSLVHMAERHGLIVRPHEKSIRFAPPQDRRHYLLTIWANPPGENGGIQYDIYPDGFVKFYGVSQEEATRLLGDTGQYEVEEIALTDIPKLIRAIDTLLSNTSENSNHSTYLLTWNPGKSDWMNFAEDWENVYLGNRPLVEWSCGNTRRIQIGDRIFMMRLGWREKVTGIVASGRVTGEPIEGQHWAEENRTALYVEFEPDVLLNSEIDELFNPKNISQVFNWHPQSSGIRIPDEIAVQLEQHWQQHVQKINLFHTPDESAKIESKTFVEGSRRLVYSYRYERDPNARRACVERYGTLCAVCEFDFGEVFGDIGQGFIHVHHLTPVSEIAAEYAIDPIKDLRPVCPNCHAMLHRRNPPYSIDELKAIRAQNNR